MGADHPNAVEQSTTDSEQTTTHAATAAPTERWVESLDDLLPSDLRDRLEAFLNADSVETLSDWGEIIRDATESDAIGVADLCHTSGQSSHYGVTDGERYDFACFYDAVVLAALEDTQVDVHTESPEGTTIEASVDEDGTVSASPTGAVFSLGVSETASGPDEGRPSNEQMYAAVCPYVRAFPDVAAYEAWATDVDAATVALPLDGATGFAAYLAK